MAELDLMVARGDVARLDMGVNFGLTVVLADVLAASATGIVAPAGTPAPIVQVLSAAMKRVIEDAAHRQQLIEFSLIPAFMDPDAYAAFWTDTEQRMGPVLRTIRPN